MLTNRPSDVIHKLWMYRILTAICDTPALTEIIRFKGGTYAAMRNLIDRFSVDLDFDLIDEKKQELVHVGLKKIFGDLGLEIKEFSKHAPQYFVKYPSQDGGRNTVKIEVTFPVPKANTYEAVRLPEIDRIIHAQTIPTLVANKLVAIVDRYKRHGSIAGRDIFDINSFLSQGLTMNEKVIEERTGKSVPQFIEELTAFITKHISQQSIDEDLNVLLPTLAFKKVRKNLKQETLMLIQNLLPLEPKP